MAQLTRRTFIKGGTLGAAVAAAGLTATALAEEAAEAPAGDYDVIVIGGGGAGLSAAIAAVDAGATVLVLEKNSVTGGTTSTSQGLIGGYDSWLQKEQGIELTYEEMLDNLGNNASWRLDPELMGITVEQSGPSIDWLHDRCGVVFQEEVKVGYGPLQMMHVVDGMGLALTDTLAACALDSGVEIVCDAQAAEIVMTDGAPTAVKTVDGTTYGCKALVIATGGYSCNPELAARFTPEVAGTMGIGHPMATGDGIIMAANVGACTSHTDSMMCVLKDYEIMTEYTPTSAAANVNGFTSLANMIMVGAAGTRFTNEAAAGYMSQDLNRPVFDQMHKDGLGYVWMISDQATIDATEGKTKRGEELQYVTAETPEDLAAAMGVDPAGLAATIEAYNAAVEAGFDAEFGRVPTVPLTAPFVALAVTPCSIITYGGIARNASSEVLRTDGTSIPGMYCAGETSCNSAFMGFTISNAITWGKMSGENAAAYALA